MNKQGKENFLSTQEIGEQQKRSRLPTSQKFLPSRVEEFREETLRAHDDGIFCEACKEVVAVKKSNLKAHISSKKHELNKEKLKKTNKREEDIAKALQKYDQEKHPKGDTSNINKGVTSEGSAGVPEERHPSESYRVLPRYF